MNHKWDVQYKMLLAATNKEISDLKQQVEILSSADSQMRNGPFQLQSAGIDKRVCGNDQHLMYTVKYSNLLQ